MATKNERYMVTVNSETAHTLRAHSKYKNISISKVIGNLINEALEIEEDMYWSKIAEEAEKKAEGKPLISAEEVWKKCGLI